MDTVTIIKTLTWLAYPLGLASTLLLFALFLRITDWIKRSQRQKGLGEAGFGKKSFGKSSRGKNNLGKRNREKTRVRKVADLAMLLALITVLVFSNPKIAARLAASLESRYPALILSKVAKHDAILVLGGGLQLPLPPAGRPQLGAAADRYWYAYELFIAKKADLIVIAAGNAYPQKTPDGSWVASEAYFARAILEQWGVPSNAILIETSSRTTGQNKQFVEPLLAERSIESVLLVTSATHMPRSMQHFSDLDVSITPAPANFLVQYGDSPAVFDWIPAASALQLSTQALHEYYGMTALVLQRWWHSDE